MELNQNLDQLKARGIGLVGISYDSPGVLKNFTERQGIRYPLLSDADSAIIRKFGLLNEAPKPGTLFYGIPHPVTYITDTKGTITSKYFDEDYRQRQTLAALLMRDYDVNPDRAASDVKAKHVTVRTAASTDTVRSGQRILLTVNLAIPDKFHVYAPGATGYLPVEWKLGESASFRGHDVTFPPSKILEMKELNERVPAYEKELKLSRDVTIGNDAALKSSLAGMSVVITGSLRYQACDDRLCYPPETVPLKWDLKLEPHDTVRAPKELQRK